MNFADKGERVRHPIYGEGTVVEPTKLTPAMTDTLVDFDELQSERFPTSLMWVAARELEEVTYG